MKADVFGEFSDEIKGEYVIAEIFGYEAMRSFGDRLFRLETRNVFAEKLSQCLKKEFEMEDPCEEKKE